MLKSFILILLFLSSNTALASENTKTVRLVVGEWEPYTSSFSNPHYKISEELVRAAYQTQGYKVIIDHHPWARAYRYVQTGKYDGTFPWFKTTERESLFIFSTPLFVEEVVFIYHQDSQFHWENIDDLNKYRVGATQAFTATDYLISQNVNVTIENSDETNYIKLAKHRIDVYPAALKRGDYMLTTLLTKEQSEKLHIHPKPIMETEMFIMFSLQDIERRKLLSEAFTRGLNMLIDSGQYKEIMEGLPSVSRQRESR
ncbi:hypothetical protein GCM10007938_07440 [Vibrio zhanjiangensis]|uniref:Solute-binding protein family 3/N-terminal domain-containing protein n=1 Tax=Vibrio zhanjiangensis TaxID=1046128 RepID=A0ABQ6EVC8_9VIBR|nr:transporter substrate-binding domain-containing protein [Vibrio zhanjiangensis]GLT16967.1 hypothetical protein GCM10007938_07440 [Vibrio zhanjiangensis]